MKKIITSSLTLIIFLATIFALFPTTTLAAYDCPYGKIDDPFPGDCGRYVDTNSDNLCDHSQELPGENTANTINENTNLETSPTISVINAEDETVSNQKSKTKQTYHLIPISLFLTTLYIITRTLSKKKKIRIIDHKRIWNVLLLISFIISGTLGVLLIIQVNFGITFSFIPNILFWHVEAGIAMFAICITHISERWYFFRNMFKVK